MAQDPLQPKVGGSIKLPKVDAGHNKVAPRVDAERQDYDDPKERKSAAAKDTEILARMRKRFDRCISAEKDNRTEALDDLKFVGGDQWPSTTKALREADHRPMLTINKLPTFIHQVTNDQRMNRPQMHVSPVGDKSDKDAAAIYRGWIRSIERDSKAELAYDTAFESAARMGWGFWRVVSEFESDDSFVKVLRVRRIRNPFTVYLDPDRQLPDGSDARFGFITEMIPREEFRELHPDAEEMPWLQYGVGEDAKNWADKDNIRVAEYFEIEVESRELVALDNGHVGWEDELDPQVRASIDAGSIQVVKRRSSKVAVQTWYRATAVQILERQPWPGKYVPIVEVLGEELDIQGKVKKSGIVRGAKDAQRMYNYWSTAETELIALAPKAPFVMEEGQVEGHERQWKQANVKSYPYLLYKGTNIAGRQAPPPQRQPFAGSPQGVVQAKVGAAQDMMATTGIRFDATMHERLQDESGRAIRELRRSGDLGSFHYVDNLSRALTHCGNILIDLAPRYLDTKQIATILREDDTEERILIDPNASKAYTETRGQDGKTLKIFNPKLGKYAVTVVVGPSFATKRIEAAESMMAFATALPNTAALIADLIAKNQDWPGADEMARRLAKAVPPQLLTPDQKDVPPQVAALLQNMDAQIKQLTMQLQQASAALNDRTSDRQVAQDKINKDFEAKLYAILQKAEDSMNAHVGKLVDQVLHVADMKQTASQAGNTGPEPGEGTNNA